MWATLAAATCLSLAPGDVKLSSPRMTYGILGEERKDTKLLPGDVLFLAYDIEDLTVAADGKIEYAIGLKLFSKKDPKKAIFTQDPQDLASVNSLGGNRRPAFAQVEIGTDTTPGQYTVEVTVTDRGGGKKASATLTYDFEVAKPTFGFTRVFYTNEATLPAPPLGVVGQTLIVNFAVVGFDLKPAKDAKDPKDPKSLQPHLDVEMQLLEDGKKPTVDKPFSFSVETVDEKYKKLVPLQFTVQLNRPGKFTVRIKATDKHSGASITKDLDLTVLKEPGR
jgi:hypothetical protein